ncbi:uncharacterized protein LOC132933995 [Metopolophium dirhodum]|uniref:uncharacterized protein LOC132933995 n=1 Tax=Metopolophium dirhodum TaxID=44670 RepID=UPI00298FB69C|nr:uncharacterized protein LOC132933995 [Metopolophium dirhodum]
MSHYYALWTVLKTFNALIETLQVIRDTEGPGDRQCGITAGGLLKYFTSEIFLLTAYSFENMFKIFDKTSQHLQSPDFDIYCATMLIEDNLKSLNKLRTDELFNEISDQTKKLIIDSDYEFEPLPQHRSRKRKQMADENAIDEVIILPIQHFKVNTYFSALDCIITQLTERFIGNSNTSSNSSKSPDKSTLGLLKDISLLSKKRLNEVKQNIKKLPVDAFDVFGKIYSKFVQPDNARHEYKEFCNYFELLEKCESLPNMLHDNRDTAVCFEDSDINQEEDFDSENDNYLISNKEDNDASEKNIKNHGSLTLIYRLFCNHGSLKIMFPTLFTMYKIALTLPVGSVETERSFSKLKIIKNRLCSTMSNDRLEALMRINCEQDIDIDYTCVIDKFSLKSHC